MQKRPITIEHKKIETMISTTTNKVEIFQVRINSLSEHFSIDMLNWKGGLGGVINPNYQEYLSSELIFTEFILRSEKL